MKDEEIIGAVRIVEIDKSTSEIHSKQISRFNNIVTRYAVSVTAL